MGISVKEALSFNGFSEAKVVAGQSGLDRIIKRVSVIECPDYNEYKKLLREGDFFLTSFFAVKDDTESLLNTVKTLVDCGSSGLCVIDAYFSAIPDEIIEFANAASYPVLMISSDVPYADIITDIMDAIIQMKDNTIMELKINDILQPGKSGEVVRRAAYDINPNFRNNILALYFRGSKSYLKKFMALKKDYTHHSHWSVVEYRKGILFILSFANNNQKLINLQLQSIIKNIEFYSYNFKLGVSNLHEGLHNLGISISEALFACDAGHKITEKNIIYYKDLGIYKLLLPLQNSPELKKFHDDIIMPIMEYDKKNNAPLLKTAAAYIESGGDLKKTSQALFQHVNTIRYRLSKIKDILKMEELNGEFYEQLSIAVKINKILRDTL